MLLMTGNFLTQQLSALFLNLFTKTFSTVEVRILLNVNAQGGARNVIPLIVHVTHFYYYKNI